MKKKKGFSGIAIPILIFVFGLIVTINVAVECQGQSTANIDMLMESVDKGLNNVTSSPFEVFKNFGKYELKWTGIYCFVVFLAVAYYSTSKKNTRTNKEHGSARWGTAKEGKKYVKKKEKNTVILAEGIEMSMDTRYHRRNLNALIIGGSGTGKSRFYSIPNIMQETGSYVITDPKGELFRETANMLDKDGYVVKCLNLLEMERSCGYNPFQYIRDENDILIMIKCLIKNTNPDKGSGGDPFWEKSETALLQAIVFYLLHQPEESNFKRLPKNMNSLFNMVQMANMSEASEYEEVTEQQIATYDAYVKEHPYDSHQEINKKFYAENNYTVANYNGGRYKGDENGKLVEKQDELDKRFEELEKLDPGNLGTSQYKIFKIAPKKTAMSILISLGVRLSPFNVIGVKKILEQDTLELDKMGDRKQVLFVIIPDNDETYNFIAAMMYSQLFTTLYRIADFGITKVDSTLLPTFGNKVERVREYVEITSNLEKSYEEEKVTALSTRKQEYEMLFKALGINVQNEQVLKAYSEPSEYITKALDDDWKTARNKLSVYSENISKIKNRKNFENIINLWLKTIQEDSDISRLDGDDRLYMLYGLYSASEVLEKSNKKECLKMMKQYSEILSIEYGLKAPNTFEEKKQTQFYNKLEDMACGIRGAKGNGGALKYHVRCILDEFANIGEIPNFSKIIATMRSRGLSASVILQDLSQIKKIHEKDWQSIIGNCDSFLFLGSQENETDKYMSEKLGKETIDKKSSSVSKSKNSSSSTSWDVLGRELMQADEIARMENEKCIVMIRGTYPFFVNKFNVEKHPKYTQLVCYSPKNTYKKDFNIDQIYEESLKAQEEENKRIEKEKELLLLEQQEKEREKELGETICKNNIINRAKNNIPKIERKSIEIATANSTLNLLNSMITGDVIKEKESPEKSEFDFYETKAIPLNITSSEEVVEPIIPDEIKVEVEKQTEEEKEQYVEQPIVIEEIKAEKKSSVSDILKKNNDLMQQTIINSAMEEPEFFLEAETAESETSEEVDMNFLDAFTGGLDNLLGAMK